MEFLRKEKGNLQYSIVQYGTALCTVLGDVFCHFYSNLILYIIFGFTQFFVLLLGNASSTMWTCYSMLNSTTKAKYNISLKIYPRVTTLLKSYDVDVKKKAATFSKEIFDKFVGNNALSTPFWLVRKVCLGAVQILRQVMT
jgi:hypothetical protein